MAETVQIKLIGDDKAFVKTLQKLRDRFKEVKTNSDKAQKAVKAKSKTSKTALTSQKNTVRLLSLAFVRLGRIASASQKLMQTQIRKTSTLLRSQIKLLKQAKIIPQGSGGRQGVAPARPTQTPTAKQAKTPISDQSQFASGRILPTRGFDEGTRARDVNKSGNLNQRALVQEETSAIKAQEAAVKKNQAAQATAARQKAVADKRSIADEKRKAAATKKSTGAIRKQSQPVTLLVAKFALMAFAVQTLANIVNSTFGAILQQIDEFRVAAIGTAAAISGVAQGGQGTSGEIFNQNLDAALATFEELEIVAARFFSTGQELQLAFNTLAQRGVVVRQEEFETLGKITDQIKLLTGGQNTQIQIQQELRAILDGNVRTTTAFGKALQARGVDVGQLSKEVKATGSLKPFEPFLEGLSAAGPAIRRTLSSVTATFSSLFNILTRNIFQDTFDGVVSQITAINNLIIDQRDLIVRIGIFVKSKIAAGWDVVLGVLDQISGTILNIASHDLAAFGAGILLTAKLLKRGPLGIILGIGTGLATASGDVGVFGATLTIIFNAIKIAVDRLLKGIDFIVTRLAQLFELIDAFFTGGFDLRKAISQLQKLENKLRDLQQQLQDETREALFLFELDKRSEQEAQDLIALLRKIEDTRRAIGAAEVRVETGTKNISRTQEGKDFIEQRGGDLGSSFTDALATGIKDFAKFSDKVAGSAVDGTKDQMKGLLEEFKKLSQGVAIPPRKSGDFTDSIIPVDVDRERIVRQLKATEAVKEAARTRELSQQQAANAILSAQAKRDFDSQLITGREFFSRQQALRREDLGNQQRVIRERLESVQALASRELALIELAAKQRATEAFPAAERARDGRITVLQKEKNLTTEQRTELESLLSTTVTIAGLTKKTNDEEKESTAIENAARAKQVKLLREILGLKTKGRVQDEKDLGVIKEQNRLNKQQLDNRGFALAKSDGETNSERSTRITAQGNQLQAQFAAKNSSTEDQTTFGQQQDQLDIAANVKTQTDAIKAGIDAAFSTIIDGFVEGSFEFRELAQTLSKDFIKAGFEGIINQVKDTVVGGLTKVFTALGDGSEDAAAGAARAAQTLLVGFGLLLAVLSRSGNKGDFEATGGGGGGGIDQSSVQTRGLIGGDTQIAIAEINNGLQEALIPTNAILAQIEQNTRALSNIGGGSVDLEQIISNQVNTIFQESILQNA